MDETWQGGGSGLWSDPSRWLSAAGGAVGAAPGAQDNAAIAGPDGAASETISGPGQAAVASFTGNTYLSGAFALGTLTLGSTADGAMLELLAGSLAASLATVERGTLQASGAGTGITVAGLLTLGALADIGLGPALLEATGGASIRATGLTLDGGRSCSVYVDSASSIEIGTAGNAAAGALTIDAGFSLSGNGVADAYGQVANNGTISASGGTLLVGALSGTGELDIGAGATLALNGVTGAGQSVVFRGQGGALRLMMEVDAPSGTITGFAAGDVIDVAGSIISSAAYNAATGQLVLYYGGQVAATLQLAGTYAGQTFLVNPDGRGGTQVTVAALPAAASGAGTATADRFAWSAPVGGTWGDPGAWQDLSRTGALVPGAGSTVAIAGPTGAAAAVISGTGAAGSLTVTGNVAFAGTVQAGGTLTLGSASAAGTLDLLAGATLSAGGLVLVSGALVLAGGGASIGGTLALGGGPGGYGMPASLLSVTAGGVLRAGTLTLGGGSTNTISTDSTGAIEVGAAGGALAP
ncbi:MAG TPA: hypothetical protein VMI52_02395, partial [Acetobacteraceae bacterium]|nr:hypothetical protein [Acetobacteraceae bacterium]